MKDNKGDYLTRMRGAQRTQYKQEKRVISAATMELLGVLGVCLMFAALLWATVML